MATGRELVCWTTLRNYFLLICFTSTVSGQAVAWGTSIEVKINSSLSIEYIRYSTNLNWTEAAEKCGQAGFSYQNQHLLCFDRKTEITSIIPRYELVNFKIWLSGTDCNLQTERCIYLHINANGKNFDDWNYHVDCNQRIGFICRKYKFTNEKIAYAESVKACPATNVRNVNWPESPGNINISMKCPNNMKGFAKWYCNGTTGEWGPWQPSLANCRSVALTAMLQNISNPRENKIDLQETANQLRQMMKGLDTGGDVITTVSILDKVEDVFVSQAPAMNAAQRKKLAVSTSENVIHVCDQLLTKSSAWNDLEPDKRHRTASTFLTAVDETGNILASSIEKQKHEIFTSNVVLRVVRNGPATGDQRTEEFKTGQNHVAVVVGPNTQHVTFAFYADLRDILLVHQEDSVKVLNSPVISANLSSGDLKADARVRLQHFNTSLTNPVCAYWDMNSLRWSDSGCRVVESNTEYTVCECSHLTNFAILMDMKCTTCGLGISDKVALSVITVVGCSISIICLSICIVIFTFYRELWGMRVMIHRNLCICLLLAQAVLLGGLERTENKTVCSLIAGVLHYLFLASFFWMFLEAFHIMWLLIKVFNPKQSHVSKFYIAGYGLPAIIVAITAGVKHTGYGTKHFCWLNTEDGTIWGFAGPVIVIILFNSLSLGYALYKTLRVHKARQKMHLEGIKMWVRGAAVLSPLLGVTWIIGVLYVEKRLVVFAYIFAVLNSLQGFGIFLFHCCLNKKVKDYVSRTLRRSSSFISSSVRGTTRTSKTPSVKGSVSPKRSSKFFVNSNNSETQTQDDKVQSDDEINEQAVAFINSKNDKRDRLNTNELYPLEIEKT